ncbi:MAG: hypothetical protein JWO95_3207, partial [Verrucomicrobiales bacterium]|nr:hypothetical protein [Verrucomicrobiales bacterium]
MQGSTNLVDWVNVGQREYGNGHRHSKLASTQTTPNTYYRVVEVVVTNIAGAFAPWSLAGLSFQMNDDANSPDRLNFPTETNGTETSGKDVDGFTYSASKTSDSGIEADILFNNGKSNVVTFTFGNTNSGTFVNEDYANGRLKDRGTGIFHLVDGGASNPAPVLIPSLPPAPPVSLSNMVYYFQTVSTPDVLQFRDNANGLEIPAVVEEGNATNAFAYTYSALTTNTASLQVNFGYYGAGGDRYEFE